MGLNMAHMERAGKNNKGNIGINGSIKINLILGLLCAFNHVSKPHDSVSKRQNQWNPIVFLKFCMMKNFNKNVEFLPLKEFEKMVIS